jgi:hypothetical protein
LQVLHLDYLFHALITPACETSNQAIPMHAMHNAIANRFYVFKPFFFLNQLPKDVVAL